MRARSSKGEKSIAAGGQFSSKSMWFDKDVPDFTRKKCKNARFYSSALVVAQLPSQT
jgi:predicted nucleic-acid-binding Zn-ribbon protein